MDLEASLTGTVIPCSGRKKAALTYVATYAFGCFTKHWNNFQILLVGRIFCGVATSLLYSAFESWLVAEHFKVSMPSCTHGCASLAVMSMTKNVYCTKLKLATGSIPSRFSSVDT